MYVIAGELSFDLYYRSPSAKDFRILGYYTDLSSLVKKITAVRISRDNREVTLGGFVREWDSIQQKVLDKLKEYEVF